MSEPAAVLTFESDQPCRGCGLNLRGLPKDNPCPQCGMNQHAVQAPSRLSGTVSWELKCARCSYLLKGLDRGNACPECGLPIAESLRPMTLRTHANESLRKARGALIGVSVGVAGLILAVILTVIGWSSMFGARGAGAYGFGLLARTLTRESAMVVCAFSAIVFVRELMPKSMERAGRPGSARVTVVGAWMMLVCSLLILGLNAVVLATSWTTLGQGGAGGAGGVSSTAVALASLTGIVWLPTLVGLGLAYFGGLALLKWVGQQCGSARVTKRATRLNILSISLLCAIPVLYLVAFIGLAAAFGGFGGGGSGGLVPFLVLPFLLFAGVLVAVVMFLTLLRMVRRELTKLIESSGEPGVKS